MIDTFLFDLDGTLLPMDTQTFIDTYFHELGKAFSDITHPKLLLKNVIAATDEMISNQDYITNEEVFMKEFNRLIDGDMSVYMNRFDNFYNTQFDNVKRSTSSLPLISECIKLLKEKNYTAAIATNPIFPQVAIHKRIEWSGLNISDFSHITSYEGCHYCKPYVQFYQEILDVMGKKPEQCIMVGNDVQEDLVAGKLGMQTFLITNNMINRENEKIESTYTGTYEDFYRFVQGIKPIE
ncbi:MAG: HAD family hydrolase [Pseudomonadota bacterium]